MEAVVCKPKFKITTNWNILGDVDINRVVCDSVSDSKTINVDDISAGNCICLVNNNCDEKSKAFLEIKANGNISDIALISEAQIIEVFGVNDEYLLTYTSDFIDDWEEMAVYCSNISLPNIPVCKLKFSRTKCEDRIWIYGAKFNIQKSEALACESSFNVEQIQRLLENSNFKDLNNSSNFKNFLQFYFTRFPPNNFNYLGKTCQADKKVCSYVATNNVQKEDDCTRVCTRLCVNSSNPSDCQKLCSNEMLNETLSNNNNWFVAYIDKKFHEIKKDILQEVDLKLSILKEENNLKLDKIISLLEKNKVKI